MIVLGEEKETRAKKIALRLLEQLKGEGISVGEAQRIAELLTAMIERKAREKSF
jgi:hypothetical protein